MNKPDLPYGLKYCMAILEYSLKNGDKVVEQADNKIRVHKPTDHLIAKQLLLELQTRGYIKILDDSVPEHWKVEILEKVPQAEPGKESK